MSFSGHIYRLATGYFIRYTRTFSKRSSNIKRTDCNWNDRPKPKKPKKIPTNIYISDSGVNPSSETNVHLIGMGGKGFCRSVMIVTPLGRYLFNCGEGTQRLMLTDRLKLSKLEHLFLTSSEWSSIGGLIGLLFSLESHGVPKITLHGPPNVEGISSMCKHLGQSDGTQLEKRYLNAGSYEDINYKFQYVPLFCVKSNEEASRNEESGPGSGGVSVAYICTPKPSPRNLDMDKCLDLALSPSEGVALMKTGESVTLEDGSVITYEDILKPTYIPPSFIIVDCPHSGFLAPLIDSEEFKKYQNLDENNPIESKLGLIIHLTPEHIVKLPEYQRWMNSFGANVKHIVFDDSSNYFMHNDVRKMVSQLNLLHPELFPLLPAVTTPTSTQPDTTGNIIRGENNLIYQIKPNEYFSRKEIINTCYEDFQSEITNNPKMAEAIKNFKREVAKLKLELPKDDRVFPEIVFLGTGASMTSKYRNCTGILLRLDENNSMLLDCGEGTVSQLYCHYGDQTDAILRTINGIFISHMHSDHHLGLFGIVLARLNAFGEEKNIPKLVVVASSSMKRWIDYIDVRSHRISEAISYFYLNKLRMKEKVIISKLLKVNHFDPFDVDHCVGATGVCLKFNGFKLVYSGDTMPCENLVQHGKDCDLLIHEATFDEGMEQEARRKTHSTTTQAIEIGRRMNAKQIILTHFTQRSTKVPLFNKTFTSNVGVAFDHMTIRPCDYPYLSLLIKPLAVLFEENIKFNQYRKKRDQLKNDLINEIEACTNHA